MAAFGAAYRGDMLATTDPGYRNKHYAELEAWWRGDWTYDTRFRSWARKDPSLYRGTLRLWSQTSRIVDLYTQFVYPGPLSKDGKPLPDGTRGAIPLDPETGSETTDQYVIDAFSTLMDLWQWSQYKSLRTKTAAIYGECLTELVEDLSRGSVTPNTIPPREIVDIRLDDRGHVKAYVQEYMVYQSASTAYGKVVQPETYRYRKEVDTDAIRYFRDDRPFDYGNGDVVPNPYGFVPAVWDRHEIMSGSDYGIAATEKTFRQTQQLNSILSHAIDYQRTQFSAPVGIKGASLGRQGSTVTMPGLGNVGNFDSEWDIDEARRKFAESMRLIQMGDNGEFVTVTTDLGQTKDLLEIVMDSIKAENPEGSVSQELLQMTQLTAPGVERALSIILGLVYGVRDNQDPRTMELLGMGAAMMGMRLQNGDYPPELVRARADRYDPLRRFNLDSYGQGLLKCSVGPRPIFQESADERTLRLVQMLPIIESGDPWLMSQAGIPQEEIDRIVREQEQARQEQLATFAVAGAANVVPGRTGATGPSGTQGRTGPSGPTSAAA